MKKISLLLVGVLVSSLTFAGRRDDSPKSVTGMAVIKSNTASFKLIYKAEASADVRVKIFDNREVLVFSETIRKSDGFIRPYNFENLPEGTYTIRIDNGSNWMTETVTNKSGEVERLAHLTELNGGKYLLTVPGKGEDEIAVKIFDENGDTLYSDHNAVNGNFAQIYNLGKRPGPFSFEVTDRSGVSTVLKK